jgi:2'-5' RNA ligase
VTLGRLEPSDRSALGVVVALPPALDALRRRRIPEAAAGIPAHITLLFPFADPAAIDESVRRLVAATVARHPACSVALDGPRIWPDTIYAGVDPAEPLTALQAALAVAFPTLPVYGGGIDFVPHVTISPRAAMDDAGVIADPAWAELPITLTVAEVDLFVHGDDGRWRSMDRFPLEVGA